MRAVIGGFRRAAEIGMAGVAIITAALGVPTMSGVASAAPATGAGPTGTYLALGDSVAFGYVPPEAVPAPNYADASSFVAYPEDVAQQLGEAVSNAACPGETSASLLTAGAQSNGCENAPGSQMGYRTQYPLHVPYQGTQMAYALTYLADNPHTRLVTINIGANDFFLCQETTADKCTSSAEVGALVAQIEHNLGSIYQQIRDVAHYQGPLVALTYYSLTYSDPAAAALTKSLDSVLAGITTRYGGIVADGFAAFQGPSMAAGGDPCAAGLLIKLPDGTCNIHPSAAGHMLLASAITNALAAGCWLAAGDGGVFSSGPAARFHGSAADVHLAQPIVGMAPTPDRAGYWLVARDGGVLTYGDATFFGSTGAMRLNQPIVAMAATTDGNGYWLLGADGGVFSFGDATFIGSAVGRLQSRAVAIEADASGLGYRILSADGTVVAFGVPDLGSSRVNAGDAAVGMAMTPDGGYWIVTRAGQVKTSMSGPTVSDFGQVTTRLNAPIVAIVGSPDSRGYDLVAADGSVFAFGDTASFGSTGALRLNSPVVGAAAAT
jgi:lysophospholipase L1-like esterase